MSRLLAVALCVVCASAAAEREVATVMPPENSHGCTVTRAEKNPEFQTKPQAAIYGRTLNVPRMRIRAYDTVTERALEVQRLRVLYAWEWLDYPYPGTELGNWSAAWDVADCPGARAGSLVEVPAFQEQPRGWYGGHFARYPFARRPHATRIVLETLVTDSCRRKAELTPGEVDRLARDILVITTSCSPQAGAGEKQVRLRFERAR